MSLTSPKQSLDSLLKFLTALILLPDSTGFVKSLVCFYLKFAYVVGLEDTNSAYQFGKHKNCNQLLLLKPNDHIKVLQKFSSLTLQ